MTKAVSATIIVWDRPWMLTRAVHSILTQTYRVAEVIIVGDGCLEPIRKEYEQVIAGFNDSRIKFDNLKKHINRHRYAYGLDARNRTLELVTGDYIAPLDDDDIWVPWHLERAIEIMEKQPEVGMVCGQFFSLAMKTQQTQVVGRPADEEGGIPRSLGHLTAVYRSKYKHIKYPLVISPRGPSDQGLWREIHKAGAQIHFDPVVHGIHYSTVT